MLWKPLLWRLLLLTSLTGTFSPLQKAVAASCVWKVTGPNGGTLYLGGSVHVLRPTDYPLPAAYNYAFDASTRLVFEMDPKDLRRAAKGMVKAGEYPKQDSLKNHVDRRTYDYLRRFFALLPVAEDKFSRYRPWFLAMLLESMALHEFSRQLGVESFLERRAAANLKPVSGLESLRETVERYSKLSDRQSEALLLLTFIPAQSGANQSSGMLEAWRRGDVDALAQAGQDAYRDFPSLRERIVTARNRNWLPKLESFLHGRETCFVVVGAGHVGGAEGLLSILRARGYRIEQL
ncbi:MAG: TraB/GumN family protein [Chthoniobacterales bacterium]